MILSDNPYKPLGAPPVLMRGNVSTISRDLNASQVGCAFPNVDDGLIWSLERRNNKKFRADYASTHHSRRIRFQWCVRIRLPFSPETFTRIIGHVLNEFVRNCALPYLEEDHLEVRKAAALTCCSVFRRDPIGFQGSNNSIEIISDVIDKLLTVGIADPGPSPFAMVL